MNGRFFRSFYLAASTSLGFIESDDVVVGLLGLAFSTLPPMLQAMFSRAKLVDNTASPLNESTIRGVFR